MNAAAVSNRGGRIRARAIRRRALLDRYVLAPSTYPGQYLVLDKQAQPPTVLLRAGSLFKAFRARREIIDGQLQQENW